jgi:hypothetical protein
MNMLSNEQILERLDAAFKGITTTTTAGAAVMQPQYFDRYIRTLQLGTKILPEARFQKMEAQIVDIDRIGFLSRIMRAAAAEGSALAEGDWAEPTFGQEKLIAVEAQAIVSITDKLLRRNIEKQRLEDTIVDLMGEQSGIDLEELGIEGDTGSSDTYLALTNGWLKKATGWIAYGYVKSLTDSTFDTGVGETTKSIVAENPPVTVSTWELYDTAGPTLVAHDDGAGAIVEDASSGIAGTINYNTGAISLTGLTESKTYEPQYDSRAFNPADDDYPENLFEALLQQMFYSGNMQYLGNRNEWRFYVPWNIENAYRDLLKGRGTQLGDETQTMHKPLMYKGIPVVYVPKMPDNRALLSHPDNMVYGVFHEVEIEREREAKAKRTDMVMNVEVDFNYELTSIAFVAEVSA